jgi:hypothetical protein
MFTLGPLVWEETVPTVVNPKLKLIYWFNKLVIIYYSKSQDICLTDFGSLLGKPKNPLGRDSRNPLKLTSSWKNPQQQFPFDSTWINFRSFVKIRLDKFLYRFPLSFTVFIDLNSKSGSIPPPDPDSEFPRNFNEVIKVKDPTQLNRELVSDIDFPITSSPCSSEIRKEKKIKIYIPEKQIQIPMSEKKLE